MTLRRPSVVVKGSQADWTPLDTQYDVHFILFFTTHACDAWDIVGKWKILRPKSVNSTRYMAKSFFLHSSESLSWAVHLAYVFWRMSSPFLSHAIGLALCHKEGAGFSQQPLSFPCVLLKALFAQSLLRAPWRRNQPRTHKGEVIKKSRTSLYCPERTEKVN